MYGNNLYGLSFYADNSLAENIEKEECYIDLMPYLPKYWHYIGEMLELQKSLGKEIGILNCTLKELFAQCFIDTATWGLELWEKELNLQLNKNMLYEHKREIIKAKLRGTATTTKDLIKNVAIAFSGGEVEIIEHNSEYYFEIKFIGIKGILANMSWFKNIIEEIKPAHLGIVYSYKFTVWLHAKNHTWNGLKQKSWYDVKVLEEG